MLDLEASFSFIDSHTAGHPTRVILSGIPRLEGATVLAQREDFRHRLDHLRPALLHEPAGHAAMVGLIPVPSRTADYGAFFISSYVYLDMCGHGTIGYARTLAATGQLSPATGASFTLETPAGVIPVGLDWCQDGALGGVRLRNVPAYVACTGFEVVVPEIGPVRADIVYGGMWYALVEAASVGLTLAGDQVAAALAKGAAIKRSLTAALAGHPCLDGRNAVAPSVLLYADEPDTAEGPAGRHLLVLEANKFDRSPCGTGTAARLAQLAQAGRIGAGQAYRARNLLGAEFTARIVAREMAAGQPAVVAEIGGDAFVTAFGTLVKERHDPLRGGFLCR